MPLPARPEDVMPDEQSFTEVNGTRVRKGTAGAFFANLRTLNALPAGSPDRGPIVLQLRASVGTMRDLGLFDLFAFRSPELGELLGVAP